MFMIWFSYGNDKGSRGTFLCDLNLVFIVISFIVCVAICGIGIVLTSFIVKLSLYLKSFTKTTKLCSETVTIFQQIFF